MGGPILATTTCDFLAPVVWPAEIVVGSRIAKVGNTSFVMEYAVAAGMRGDNPVKDAKRIRYDSDGHRTWTEEDINAFVEALRRVLKRNGYA